VFCLFFLSGRGLLVFLAPWHTRASMSCPSLTLWHGNGLTRTQHHDYVANVFVRPAVAVHDMSTEMVSQLEVCVYTAVVVRNATCVMPCWVDACWGWFALVWLA